MNSRMSNLYKGNAVFSKSILSFNTVLKYSVILCIKHIKSKTRFKILKNAAYNKNKFKTQNSFTNLSTFQCILKFNSLMFFNYHHLKMFATFSIFSCKIFVSSKISSTL